MRAVTRTNVVSLLLQLGRNRLVLARQGERIEEQQRGLARVIACLRPFTFLFGVLFFLVSLTLFVSLAWTQVMRLTSSLCEHGAACGYLLNLEKETTRNPLDFVLSELASVGAFLDIALFALVIVYLFFVTLSGIVKVGIRILVI